MPCAARAHRSFVGARRAVTSSFSILVRYIGDTPSIPQQQAFARAVARWQSVILSTSGNSRQILTAGGCGRTWLPAIDTTFSNVIIFANIGTIDGVGNVLGNANLCRLHSTGLTAIGTMLFDSADLTDLESRGLLDAVIIHEIVLGIGTLWSSRGLLADAGGADPIFTGPATLAQFLALGGAVYAGRPVPVENTGGAGTRDAHWRESVFRSELMTGFVNLGVNPLSRMTIASLQDLGFTAVALAAADQYSVPVPALTFQSVLGGVSLENDIAPIPLEERIRAGLNRPGPLLRRR